MPLFGLPSDSPQDAGQNTQLLTLSQRLASVEADRITLLSEVAALKSSRDSLIARVNQLENDYPNYRTHFWGYGKAYNGNTGKSFIYNTATGYDFYRYAYLQNAQQGDTVEFEAPLRAGAYRIRVIHDRANDRGVASFYMNATKIGEVDCYSSNKVNINRYDASEFTVNKHGINTFKCVITGKNAASSGHIFGCVGVFIYPKWLAPPTNLVLINAGDFAASYTATDGRVWQIDQYFTGGNAYDLEANLGAFTVAGTQNQRLYKFERSVDNGGSFEYNIPIGSPGIFTLKLLFSEAYHTAVGQRVGSITLNGNPLLTNFDILAEVPRRTALVKAWTNLTMPTSTINLRFTNTLVNGIELTRTN